MEETIGDAERNADGQSGSDNPLSFKAFLESVHPGLRKNVSDLWDWKRNLGNKPERCLNVPHIRLYCERCQGERNFRSMIDREYPESQKVVQAVLTFRCGDCHSQIKKYSLDVVFSENSAGIITKYGEIPGFGVPVPNRVLRLFGKDAALFLKGRQCENQGMGVGAFAYYRRVVENHKNEIIDELIKVCRTVGGLEELVSELTGAKSKFSFSESVEDIKEALPSSLLIDGHNPLSALHRALSIGLHSESDEDCLKCAEAVRLVLSELINRMHMLKQDNRELNAAVQLLLSKQSKP